MTDRDCVKLVADVEVGAKSALHTLGARVHLPSRHMVSSL